MAAQLVKSALEQEQSRHVREVLVGKRAVFGLDSLEKSPKQLALPELPDVPGS